MYIKGTKSAIIESDGFNIRFLNSSGWQPIGTFGSSGTYVEAVLVNGRLYLVNGVSAMRVVEWGGSSFSIQDAGVTAPTSTPSVSQAGGDSTLPKFSLGFAITFVDPRGFESNISPVGSISGVLDGATITVSGLQAAPTGFTRKLYGTLRDGGLTYFIKNLDQSSPSTTTDTFDSTRQTRFEGPFDHDVPPSGIAVLYYYRGRVFGGRVTGSRSIYRFSKVDEPEYWPSGNGQDLSYLVDGSDVMGFEECASGLLIMKNRSILLLRGDPEFEDFPVPLIKSRGLTNTGAHVSVDGTCFFQSQTGLLATDGVSVREVNRRISDTSDEMKQLDAASGLVHGEHASIFYHEPDEPNFVKAPHYEMERKIFLFDKYLLTPASTTVSDSSLDFSEDSDVAEHENVENGSQSIATGGGTTSITLNGVNSSKLKRGTKIKFSGSSEISVTNVSGGTISLSAAAPANGTAIDYIRGTEVIGGLLKMTEVPSIPGETYSDTVLNASGGPPVSYWRLEEPDGSSTYIDERGVSSLTKFGTVTSGITGLIAGESTTCANFPGSGDTTNASLQSTSTAYNATSNFSIGCWVTMLANVGSDGVIMGRHNGNSAAGEGGWTLRRRSTGEISFNILRPGGVEQTLFDIVPTTGQKYFLAVTYDGDVVKFYRDGVLTTSGSGFPPPPSNSATLSIGSDPQNPGVASNHWAGKIDEPFYFNRVLSASEISAMYNRGISGPTSGIPGGPPADTYLAKLNPKTSFPGFSSFASQPIQVTATENPVSGSSGSRVRFAFLFSPSDSPKVFSSGSWVSLSAVPNMSDVSNSMSIADVNSLTPSALLSSGGFNTLSPYIQVYAYLISATTNPSVDTVLIQYLSGTTTIGSAVDVSEIVDLGNGANVPIGSYIWNSAGAFRLDDGTTDDGNQIQAVIEPQEVSSGNAESDLLGVEVDVETTTPASFMEVQGISDGKYTRAVPIPMRQGRRVVKVGANQHGWSHSCRITWDDPGIKIHSLALILEPRARGIAS